ncbi:lipid droplet-associated hydrolase [Bicyclus anynana]|uniref:Lipid droplet-associated hydrolase n=1 Tax=Bicyclus anynana TaxID=110368 RepID=A0A6J1MYY1_BICAN|nr:lipid droplet-associated hydrolase [Bicyclus anynana]XP_023935787.2 lipid droplet-associated hydrolase [Bicyclus anynana]
MNRVYKNLNKIQTPLITWGDPFTNTENVLICITGNPGISDFYIDFGSELYKSMLMPVCVIGHAGHEESLDKNSKYLFNLKDQLEHKLDLIENYIHKNCKIHLIGHSIGAWMIIEILEKHNHLVERVSSVNLLFPTIQKMAVSQNGKFVNNVLRKIYRFILFLSTLLYMLPNQVLCNLIGIYLWTKSLSPKLNCAIMKILNPDIVENVFYLAFNEMDTVLSLNIEGINKIKHLTNVVYSIKDGWAPTEYMEELKQFTPHLQMIEVQKVEHAFVLKSSEEVATIVADFIKTKTNK